MQVFGGFAAPLTARPVTRRARHAGAWFVALAFALSSFAVVVAPAPTLAWSPGTFDGASEQELLTRTNQARASAGRRALRWDATLASIARSRSRDMIERNYFDHQIKGTGRYVWDLMNDRGYCYNLAGENIGWNQYWPDDQATNEIHRSFMGSPGHRDNLLGSAWDVVGIGAFKGPDGKAMWTVVFADKCGTVTAPSSSAPQVTAPSTPAKPSQPAPTPAPTARPTASVTSVSEVERRVTWRWAPASTATARACSFDVLYRDNAAPWKFLRTRTTARSISIANRTIGHTYTVKVRARDCIGNVGRWSAPRALTVS